MSAAETASVGERTPAHEVTHAVVVGVDHSATARAAAERACELADALGVAAHLVMAIERSPSASVTLGGDVFFVEGAATERQFLADLARSLPHDQITWEVRHGSPATAICDAAVGVGAQAIVVGNRRVHGVGRVLGSIATDVLRQAHCDVVVVNTTGY